MLLITLSITCIHLKEFMYLLFTVVSSATSAATIKCQNKYFQVQVVRVKPFNALGLSCSCTLFTISDEENKFREPVIRERSVGG